MGTPFRQVADFDALEKAGDGYFVGDPPGRLSFNCPCGCGVLAGISLKPAVPNGWEWNGDRDKPDCNPSILIKNGTGEHWHGYLRNGIFESC